MIIAGSRSCRLPETANSKLETLTLYSDLRTVSRKLFIFAVGIIAGIVGLLLWQNRPQPTPDTSALKNSLQTAAQNAMNLPSFSDAKLQLEIERSQVDPEVNRIKKLATELGGTAVQGAVEADGTEVLAQIPPRSVDRFCMNVRNHDHDGSLENDRPPSAPDPAAGTQIVEVKLKFVQ